MGQTLPNQIEIEIENDDSPKKIATVVAKTPVDDDDLWNFMIVHYATTGTAVSNFQLLVNRVSKKFGYTTEEAKHEISMLLFDNVSEGQVKHDMEEIRTKFGSGEETY